MVSVVPRLAPGSTFAEGESFDELVQRHERFSAEEARPLLQQLFSALAVAHAAGVVHRDLKPENVRVAGEGDALRVKVLDFGIAKDFGVDTMSGTGSPLWTAPEQAREGYQPQPSADVWALGLLTFFALAGVPYFGGRDAKTHELWGRDPKAHETALPEGFDAWFERAVSREPGARFRDASEAWQELAPLLVPRAERTERTERGRPTFVVQRPAALLTLVILSCIAMGLTIFWLLRSARI